MTELSDREKFQIDCLRNARYHEDREWFFSFIHKVTMFIIVASGTASFAWVRGTPFLAALITLVALVDLVFDVSGKAAAPCFAASADIRPIGAIRRRNAIFGETA
jgi:hypothetical protein